MTNLLTIQRGGGKIGTIFSLIVIAGLAFYVFNPRESSDEKQLKEKQETPEKALKYYLITAYKYNHNENPGGSLSDVQIAVTKDDWEWFNDNAQTIFSKEDMLDSAAVLGAEQNASRSRRIAMKTIFSRGPDHPGNEIMNRNLGPDKCVFTVRKKGETHEEYEDYKVEVVKEGKSWKVKDFAGGRNRISREKDNKDSTQGMDRAKLIFQADQ